MTLSPIVNPHPILTKSEIIRRNHDIFRMAMGGNWQNQDYRNSGIPLQLEIYIIGNNNGNHDIKKGEDSKINNYNKGIAHL